jgi:hypothetical protein
MVFDMVLRRFSVRYKKGEMSTTQLVMLIASIIGFIVLLGIIGYVILGKIFAQG